MKHAFSTLLIVIILLAGLLTWYKLSFSMDKASSFEIGDSRAPQRLLIAYQGSKFKNTVVERITEHFSTADIHIKGIDIRTLGSVDPADWTAIFICHTWELKAPDEVHAFADSHPDIRNAVFLSTSITGNESLQTVDAITSASRMARSEDVVRNAIIRLEQLID